MKAAYDLAKPFLFQLDPEEIHGLVMSLADTVLDGPIGELLRPYFHVHNPRLRVRLFGLDFPNPVGLAAGFDKNAQHVRALDTLGFGHIEVGTVTGEGQPGNDRPRLFRLAEDEALLNRMGFNNAGSAVAERQLDKLDYDGILGVNIGKTKAVPNDEAVADYEKSFRRLWRHASYFVVNVSSPNTPGLRDLQSKGPLLELLGRLVDVNAELADEAGRAPKPLLVKIAPDLTEGQIADVLEVIDDRALDGIVATNTTISRAGLRTKNIDALGNGGVSGRPVRERALEVVSFIHGERPHLPIVGVGGVFTADDAAAMLHAGASLVQVWTGFIYQGPTIVRDINQGLLDRCDRLGLERVTEL